MNAQGGVVQATFTGINWGLVALDDALATFEALGASAELPKLFSKQAHIGMDAGLDKKALTALIGLLDKG